MKAFFAALLALMATALSAQTVTIDSKWFDEYHKAPLHTEFTHSAIRLHPASGEFGHA